MRGFATPPVSRPSALRCERPRRRRTRRRRGRRRGARAPPPGACGRSRGGARACDARPPRGGGRPRARARSAALRSRSRRWRSRRSPSRSRLGASPRFADAPRFAPALRPPVSLVLPSMPVLTLTSTATSTAAQRTRQDPATHRHLGLPHQPPRGELLAQLLVTGHRVQQRPQPVRRIARQRAQLRGPRQQRVDRLALCRRGLAHGVAAAAAELRLAQRLARLQQLVRALARELVRRPGDLARLRELGDLRRGVLLPRLAQRLRRRAALGDELLEREPVQAVDRLVYGISRHRPPCGRGRLRPASRGSCSAS